MGDHVYLNIKPKKSTLYMCSYVKLAPCHCGTFEVLERVGLKAYKFALPNHIKVHNVFHVSLLKKYIHDPNHLTDCSVIEVEPEREFLPEPLHILAWEEIELRNRTIASVKVQCNKFYPKKLLVREKKI